MWRRGRTAAHAVVLGPSSLSRHPAVLGRAVEHREVELLVGGVERGEQVEHLVEHFGDARVGAVDLVDGDDRARPSFSALPSTNLVCGIGPSAASTSTRAVDHRQDALDLAAEIGVAGRVDDVDARVLPLDEVHLARMVMPRSRSRSLESMARSATCWLSRKVPDCLSSVDQRGLAVVDVGDDGDVAQSNPKLHEHIILLVVL
jgi:hypothetical protein